MRIATPSLAPPGAFEFMRVCPQCLSEVADGVSYCPRDGTHITSNDAVANTDIEHAPGTVLGAYRLLQLLGSGGMAKVYVAEHTRLGHRVAVKILHSKLARDAALVGRLFTEARAVNRISHENIVRVTDFVEGRNEKLLVMELLEGVTLAQAIAQGPLPLARVVHIGRQIASALAAVHAAGIIHRDLKPSNVMLTQVGGITDHVKLLDFGVAKASGGRGGPEAQTATYEICGTPEYMSPEQLSGVATTHLTDVYALGVVLYEAMTGRKPFSADNFGEWVIQHATAMPQRPTTIIGRGPLADELEAIVLECLAKDPHARPQSMAAVAERLGALASVVEGPRPGPRRVRRRRWLQPTITAIVLVAVGTGGLSWWSGAVGHWAEAFARGTDDGKAAAAAARPAQSWVSVRIESAPAGARVVRLDSNALIGTTPLEVVLESAAAPLPMQLELTGYAGTTAQVPRDRDRVVTVQLAPEAVAESGSAIGAAAARGGSAGRPAKKPRKAAAASPVRALKQRPSGDILDPFAE